MVDLSLIALCYTSHALFFYTTFKVISITLKTHTINRKLKAIYLCMSILIVISQILLFEYFPINRIFLSLVLTASLYFICKVNILKSVLVSSLILLVQAIIEILVMTLFVSILNIKSIQLLDSKNLTVMLYITHALVCTLLALLFKKLASKQANLAALKGIFTKQHIKPYLFITAIAIIPQIILISTNRYNYSPIFLILNFVQLAGISIFIFWYITNYLEKENLKVQNKTLEMDNKTLEGMVDGVRTIKHDFNNIFQAINGYICSKEYDDLEKYVLKVMKECNIVNTLSLINKNTFNDPAIYGVVGSKYFLATETGILMELDVTVNFKEIEFPMSDLSRIFGILLDNALEAASHSKEKYIRLEIKFNSRKNANIIRILNSYDTSINIDLSSIFKKGYSSKKIKSGIGLWEVNKIVAKNKNSQIYATIENDKFVQNLIIEICS